jgi:prolyl-tRNA synthetase
MKKEKKINKETKKEIGITSEKYSLSDWYIQILQKAELIEYTPVSGCYIIRPRAYAIWEKVQAYFDDKIKKDGVKNAYFPLLIPKTNLMKEQKHIEGFTPEVAWVTKAGETELAEQLAIRPTSETVFYPAYSKWIRSHRDLPLRINQWANMIRWEFKNPVPFIRSREFLWQEGHSAFANKEEADKECKRILDFYADTYKEIYAIPVIKGLKTEKEKFAGADYTLTTEVFLPSGKSAQAATSHSLGQNFSRAFDIKFKDKEGKENFVWQNSWGISTRSIGIAVIMHSDDKGLVLSPKASDIQVIIIPIFKNEKEKKEVMKNAEKIKEELGSFRILIDEREEYNPGVKFNDWEMKGVPLRLEIGPRDIKENQVILVRRDNGKKEQVKITKIKIKVSEILEDIHKSLYKKAENYLKENTIKTKTMSELKEAIKNKKLAETAWCGKTLCEDYIKEETGGAKIICIKDNNSKSKCVYCNKESKHGVYVAKSY